MVDPDSDILNRLTHNAGKAEALKSEIEVILKHNLTLDKPQNSRDKGSKLGRKAEARKAAK